MCLCVLHVCVCAFGFVHRLAGETEQLIHHRQAQVHRSGLGGGRTHKQGSGVCVLLQ